MGPRNDDLFFLRQVRKFLLRQVEGGVWLPHSGSTRTPAQEQNRVRRVMLQHINRAFHNAAYVPHRFTLEELGRWLRGATGERIHQRMLVPAHPLRFVARGRKRRCGKD
jgi:hypothetical protein